MRRVWEKPSSFSTRLPCSSSTNVLRFRSSCRRVNEGA
ncbi:hypothetical protein STIAU_4895, partial [Stigmatella aurantiaca DW4/3-1]